MSEASLSMAGVFMRLSLALFVMITVAAMANPGKNVRYSVVSISHSSELEIGDTRIYFEPPQNWCVFPDEIADPLRSLFEQLGPENVIHVIHGDCQQLIETLLTSKFIRDYGFVATPREYVMQQVDWSRSVFVDSMVRHARTWDPHPIHASIADRLHNAELGIRVGEMQFLGVLHTDSEAFYMGSLVSYVFEGERVKQVGVWGMTIIRGKIVTYYMYTDHNDVATLTDLLARCRYELGRLISRNS